MLSFLLSGSFLFSLVFLSGLLLLVAGLLLLFNVGLLFFLEQLLAIADILLQSVDSGSGSLGGDGRELPSSSGDVSSAGFASPDSDGGSSDGVLSTEGADIFGSLKNLNSLDLLSEFRSVSSSVLSGDSDLHSSSFH